MKLQLTLSALATLLTLVSSLPQAPSVPGNCPFDPSGEKNAGNGAGGQFIGARCLSDADCASGCCTNPCGICSGPAVCFAALGGSGITKNGCGFPLPPDGGDQCILNRSGASDTGSNNNNNNGNSNSNNNADAPPACTN